MESMLNSPPQQKSLSQKLDCFTFHSLLSSASLVNKARMLSVSSPHASSWNTATPSTSLKHNRQRDIFVEFCRQAHLSVRVEAGYGLSRVQRNTRPADVLVQDWVRGSPAAIDITFTSPLTPAMLRVAI